VRESRAHVIAVMPASTIAGLAVKALALRYMLDGETLELLDQELALSMARDIETMSEHQGLPRA
jgi:hypothetical protein